MTFDHDCESAARYEVAHMHPPHTRCKFMLYRDIYEYLGGTGVIFQGY